MEVLDQYKVFFFFTLDQLIDYDDEFSPFSKLRYRHDATFCKWQYLQLRDLFVSKYGLVSWGVSEFPLHLMESRLKTNPTIIVYKPLMLFNEYDMQCLRSEWNKKLEDPILTKQWA